MITPTAFEVRCDAWDCGAERWSPWSRPLQIKARSARDAAKQAKALGWESLGRGHWWCPRHSRAVADQRARHAENAAK